MTTDEISREVVLFVAERTGIHSERIKPETRLGEDLGVDGDDADELMEEFFGRFCVDRTGYEFVRHFGIEAPFGVSSLMMWLLGRSRMLVSIRISDLVQSVAAARWVQPQTTQNGKT